MSAAVPDGCAPSSPATCCATCLRRSVDPGDPELRSHVVVLDVSVAAWPDGRCPLRIAPARRGSINQSDREDDHVAAVL